MNCKTLIITGICMLFFSSLPALDWDTVQIEILKVPGEKIELFSDRTFYCINEQILFTSLYQTDTLLSNRNWSNIIYVELIRWNGEKLAQSKALINGNSASGSITIPQNVLSGYYYLRAYTKWMRNYSNGFYAYKLIKVINPYQSTIDAGPSQDNNQRISSLPAITGPATISCRADKQVYGTNEPVSLSLRTNDLSLHSTYYMGVVKKGALQNYPENIKPLTESPNNRKLQYLPETRGVTISGILLDKNNRQAIPGKLVSLSIPVSAEYFSTYRTNESGQFFFSVPNNISGTKDFFVHADLPENTETEILIDNDFCISPVQLPYFAFKLNGDEEQLAREMVVNMQLSQAFGNRAATPDKLNSYFFGTPTKTYLTEKYIELPNLEEFITELVTEYMIISNHKQKHIYARGYSNNKDLSPLIVIDNIPVANDENVLKLPQKKIEKVDVFDKPIIVANQYYNSILYITTKNKDMAGYTLDKNSVFFNYGLTSNVLAMPIADTMEQRIPTRRNTLFWDADLTLSPGETKQIAFTTSLDRGEYVVYIGSKENKNITEACSFKVE